MQLKRRTAGVAACIVLLVGAMVVGVVWIGKSGDRAGLLQGYAAIPGIAVPLVVALVGWWVSRAVDPARASAAAALAPAVGPDRTAPVQGERYSVEPPLGLLDTPSQGRSELIGELSAPPSESPERRTFVLYGMGGVGKSRCALEVADRASRAGRRVWWVDGKDAASVSRGMREIARELGVRTDDVSVGHLPDLIWRRLRMMRSGWLLVLDNVDDPERSLGAEGDVESARARTGWLRDAPVGQLIVITSRLGDKRTWGRRVTPRPVNQLDHADGALVLLTLAPEAGTAAEAESLSARLSGVPLALDQAGRTLGEKRGLPDAFRGDNRWPRTFSEYNEALETRFRSDLLTYVPEGGSRAVMETWELSLDLLSTRGQPECRPLLRLLSLLGDVPLPLGTQLFEPQLLAASDVPGLSGASPERQWAALQALQDRGLVTVSERQSSFERTHHVIVHPLVRETNCHQPDVRQQSSAYLALIVEILTVAVDVARERSAADGVWRLLTDLIGNAFSLLATVFWPEAEQGRHDSDAREGLVILSDLADEAADRLRAETFFLEVLTLRQKQLRAAVSYWGDEDPRTLQVRHELARTLLDLGRPKEAVTELSSTLAALTEPPAGPDPLVLEVRQDRARALLDLGDPGEAEAELRAVLAVYNEQSGGVGLPQLEARHQHGRALLDLGRVQDAADEFEASYELSRALLGEDHSQTLDSRRELGRVLVDLGRPVEAEREYAAVLEVQTRLLGVTHLRTLTTRNGWARALLDLGQVEKAESELTQVLTAREQQLGPEHLSTLTSRHERARAWQDMGRLEEAEMEFAAVLDARVRQLEPEHLSTLTTLHAHALVLLQLGRLDEAQVQFERALAGRTHRLERDHPSVLTTRHELAITKLEQGNVEEAEKELADVLRAREVVLGPGHPRTLTTRREHARAVKALANRGT